MAMHLIRLSELVIRWTYAARICLVMIAVIIITLPLGCASSPKNINQDGRTVATLSNKLVSIDVDLQMIRAEINKQSGLYEVDVTITAQKLDARRNDPNRVVARTLFYKDSRDNLIDTSAWHELILEQGKSVSYGSTSLQPASDYKIEVAYPEEVGLR